MPSDISLVDTSSSCTFTSGFEDSAGCECTSTSIKITRGFQNSNFAPGTLKFSIGNIQNPISTKPTSSFNVRTQTSDGLDIDILDSGITLTVTTPHSFTAISVSSSSLVVGAMSDYTFSITPYNPITSGGFITITPPSDITFTIALCEYSSTVITAVSCSIIGASIRVSLTISTATLTSSFSIRLRSITNPASTKQTGSFTVSSRQSFYSLDAVSSGLTLQMTTAGTMNQVSLSTSSTGINQQSVYTFVFNTVNAVKAGGYLRLDLPSQVSSIISPICTVGGVAVTCSVSSNVFTVRMFISDTSAQRFTLVIASLINGPNTITSDTFILSTYTTDNQLVDMNSALTISFTCASPCATCNNSPSNCLSCISTSITPYFWNDQCNTDCPSGQIDLGDKICVPCSSNCHTCSITTIRCTSCVLNSGLPYLDNTSCVSTCPSNSIISNDLKCEYCDQSCLTCRNTVKTCASCIAPKVLYQDQCISNCPSDVTVALNNVCISCSTNCGTCKDSVDKCSSCNGSNLLFEDDCYSSCPEDISIQTGATCTRCLASCNTCSVTVSSCTSCTSGRYLHNSQCVALCPDGYLISGTSCLQCSQECLKCSGSANYCTSCSNDMFSYGGRCVNSCPSGISIEVEKECIKCLDSCLTCESSYDKCSSCPSDSLLYNSQCLSSCPISTYETNGQCKVCDDSCDGCIGISSNCTSCAVDYYKYENTCTVNCPDKYLGISGLCAECDETCATCEETPINCKTCIGEYSLLSNICLLNCPAGYVSENSFCIEERTDFCSDLCTDELLDNDICDPVCNTTSCEYDKNKCLGPNKTEIDDYNYRPTNYSDSLYVEKDPFGICITSTIVIGTTVSSSLITASAFLPASIGILSLIESASWWALIGIIDEEESTKGRILLEISDSDVVVAFGFLISVIIIHYALNLFFFVIYYLSVRGRDIVHKNWTNKHPWATIIACFFTVMLSFKFIRLLYCNLFHISGCNAKFERISRLLNPLVFLTFLHMILVSIPMIGILLYLLSEFSTGTLTFIVSLDILILTLLMFGLSIFDVIYMNRRMAQEIDTGVRQKSPDLAMTLHDDLTLEKANTELDTNDKTRIQECFDSLRDVHNLATKRSLLNSKSAETLEFDLNAINHNRNTVSMDLNNLIADPEETELPDVEDEGFAINVQESKANRRKTLKDLTVSEISFDIIDPIEVIEVELDLANATINKNDYETILVKHLTSNEIVAVKQGFGEGFIVDEDKVIIQPQPNFDINTFELVKIDEEDVRIGIFKNRDQETVRIKRCFDGAKLIDQSENTQTMESSERIAKSNKSSSSKLSSSHNTIITEETKRELQDEARPRATGTVSSEGIEIIKKEPSKSRLLINQIRPLASRFNFQINSNQNEFDTEEVLFERDGNWVPISTESEEFIYSSRYQ